MSTAVGPPDPPPPGHVLVDENVLDTKAGIDALFLARTPAKAWNPDTRSWEDVALLQGEGGVPLVVMGNAANDTLVRAQYYSDEEAGQRPSPSFVCAVSRPARRWARCVQVWSRHTFAADLPPLVRIVCAGKSLSNSTKTVTINETLKNLMVAGARAQGVHNDDWTDDGSLLDKVKLRVRLVSSIDRQPGRRGCAGAGALVAVRVRTWPCASGLRDCRPCGMRAFPPLLEEGKTRREN